MLGARGREGVLASLLLLVVERGSPAAQKLMEWCRRLSRGAYHACSAKHSKNAGATMPEHTLVPRGESSNGDTTTPACSSCMLTVSTRVMMLLLLYLLCVPAPPPPLLLLW